MIPSYVRLNERVDENTEYHFKLIDDYGLAIGFGFEQEVKNWFKKKYPKVSLYANHQSIAFLKALQPELRAKRPNSIFVSLNSNDVLLAGFNLNKIAIYNQFSFRDQSQLVKLLRLTIKQYSEEGQETPIILYGVKSESESQSASLKKVF